MYLLVLRRSFIPRSIVRITGYSSWEHPNTVLRTVPLLRPPKLWTTVFLATWMFFSTPRLTTHSMKKHGKISHKKNKGAFGGACFEMARENHSRTSLELLLLVSPLILVISTTPQLFLTERPRVEVVIVNLIVVRALPLDSREQTRLLLKSLLLLIWLTTRSVHPPEK